MSNHGYEAGRLDLPFVGICTFGKYPLVTDWTAIDADVAILGAPFDFGTQWRAGARFGAVIILRPGLGVFQVASLLPVAAAAMWAVYNILTRLVSRVDPFETSLLYTGVIAAALVTPLGLSSWQPLSEPQWAMLLVLVVLSTMGHLLLMLALSFVEATTLQPFNYLLLVWATVMGFVFFDEFPDVWTITGGLIIVLSGLYVIWRERQLARKNVVERPLPRRAA